MPSGTCRSDPGSDRASRTAAVVARTRPADMPLRSLVGSLAQSMTGRVGLVKAPYQRRILPFLTSRVFVCTRGDLKMPHLRLNLRKLVHFALT